MFIAPGHVFSYDNQYDRNRQAQTPATKICVKPKNLCQTKNLCQRPISFFCYQTARNIFSSHYYHKIGSATSTIPFPDFCVTEEICVKIKVCVRWKICVRPPKKNMRRLTAIAGTRISRTVTGDFNAIPLSDFKSITLRPPSAGRNACHKKFVSVQKFVSRPKICVKFKKRFLHYQKARKRFSLHYYPSNESAPPNPFLTQIFCLTQIFLVWHKFFVWHKFLWQIFPVAVVLLVIWSLKARVPSQSSIAWVRRATTVDRIRFYRLDTNFSLDTNFYRDTNFYTRQKNHKCQMEGLWLVLIHF